MTDQRACRPRLSRFAPYLLMLVAGIADAGASQPQAQDDLESLQPLETFKRLTPVLIVERIEPCLELWEERLGFARTVEVPEGERLGFVILARDGIEIMYQTRASLEKDIAPLAQELRSSRQWLYIEVADLAAIEARLEGVPYVVPKRETFYGMREVIIRDAAGHAITFAQPILDSQAAGP